MTPKPIVGIIGGIGAGKSFVAQVFVPFGGCVVTADEAGHRALLQPEIRDRVLRAFGEEMAKGDGSIDRRKLGHIVFTNADQRQKLEAIVFPWINAELHRQIEECRSKSDCRFVVLDAAVLLEAGWRNECTKIVFVEVSPSVRRERVLPRGWTAQDLQNREAAQLSIESKRLLADAIVENDPKSQEISLQIESLLKNWGWILSRANENETGCVE